MTFIQTKITFKNVSIRKLKKKKTSFKIFKIILGRRCLTKTRFFITANSGNSQISREETQNFKAPLRATTTSSLPSPKLAISSHTNSSLHTHTPAITNTALTSVYVYLDETLHG